MTPNRLACASTGSECLRKKKRSLESALEMSISASCLSSWE
jgi:hypothetical protein